MYPTNRFQVYEVERFFIPPSMKCRLSIVTREVRQALEAENVQVNDELVSRCVDVGVGSVGTASPVDLVGAACTLYKQQLKMTDFEKMRAARKHFAVKYLDKTVPAVDRIYCYIFFKLLEDSSAMTKKIREVIRETSENDFEVWKEKAYAPFSLIPPVILDVKSILPELSLASLRSLMIDDHRLLKEKDIAFLVVYSEFADYGFDVAEVFSALEGLTLVVVRSFSVSSLPMDLFVQIQKCRSKEIRVCVACDTDGLTVSGLTVAHYLSLTTGCSHEHALKAVKVLHESFTPQPYALEEFCSYEQKEDESKILELQAPLATSLKEFDLRLLSISSQLLL